MKGKGHIVFATILTVLLFSLQITNSYANTYNVNVTGQYSIYSPSGGGISGSSGSFVQAISNLSNHTAYIPLTHSIMSSTYSVLNALYQNCSVPMATQLSYYLPHFNSDLQAIGTDADGIYTQSSLIKSNTDTIISQLNNITNSINNKYIDPAVSNDDKNIVTNTINTMFTLIPNDNNNDRYNLDVQTLIDQWATRDNLLLLQETSTSQYTDFY